ncbi:hypothetical protein [Paroceanicella profunda]|nr:hypothetical protein [Paroceanicella profunda]
MIRLDERMDGKTFAAKDGLTMTDIMLSGFMGPALPRVKSHGCFMLDCGT